jgi:alpha-tubulin suppressor-like RCC1 family protein
MKKFIVFILLLLVSSQYGAAQTKIKKISLGMHTTCIIDANSKLKCWGGHSSKPGRYFLPNSGPEMIDVFPAVADVLIGLSFSCALSTLGEVKCWGKVPGATDEAQKTEVQPSLVKLPAPAKSIAGISDTICMQLINGKVYCFGRNNWATPTIYSGTNEAIPVILPDGVIQLEASPLDFTALLDDGTVLRWGNFQPKAKKLNLEPVKKLMGGDTRICFILNTGRVLCEMDKESFKPVKGLEGNVVSGRTHEESGCAVLEGGQVKCWGFNGDGKIGLGAHIDRTSDAHLVAGVSDALSTEMDNGISCALLKNDTVKCWGSGFKILGNGDETFLSPYELKIPLN